jgi:glycine/D-amino acid oxidase-like deaminating enzyme
MLAVLEEKRDLYRKLGYDDVEILDRSALEARGYLRGPSAHGALRFGAAFGLHPLKYARGLAAATARRGVALCARSPVVAWSKADGWHVLATPAGTVRARRVVVATNGYTSDRLHAYFAGRTLSAASNIIVTRPLTPGEWEAVGMRTTQVYSDTRSLLFYWRRLPDDRLLYGGRGGIVETPRALAGRRAWLEAAVAKRFPVLQGIGSEYFWWGKVCLPYDMTPHVNTVDADSSVAYALGYTGTGVAMATFCGGLAADLVAGREIPRDTPLTSRGLARFPFPALRRLYLAAAYAVYRVKDRE